MANDSLLLQGFFTSDGTAKVLSLRSDFNWIEVTNFTKIANPDDVNVFFKWNTGMPNGSALAQTQQGIWSALAAPTGFSVINTTVQALGAATTITAISNDAIPVVTANGHGLITGDIVRISNVVGAQQLGAYDIRVTRVNANTFQLSWMPQIAAAAAPGALASVRRLSNELYFVPKDRVVTSISRAANAVVVFAAPHNFKVGSSVRFKVPKINNSAAYGMTEMNGVKATVLAIDVAANSITIDVDTTGFSAFVFPLTTATNMQLAQCNPVGENTAASLAAGTNILADATSNVGIIGVSLYGGENSPGGANGDLMFWQAGPAWSVN